MNLCQGVYIHEPIYGKGKSNGMETSNAIRFRRITTFHFGGYVNRQGPNGQQYNRSLYQSNHTMFIAAAFVAVHHQLNLMAR